MSSAEPLPLSNSEDQAVLILRVGEIFLKGKNRNVFMKAFLNQARRLLSEVEGATLEPQYLRALVRYPKEQHRATVTTLKRLFGLHSMCPVDLVHGDLDAICQAAVEHAKRLPTGTRFKVETKRRDKSFPVTSPIVSREVGHSIWKHAGLAVDLHAPDVTVNVEIGAKQSFVTSEVVPGPGGLPVGTAGHVGLLLSGGIDSPVAGWLAMRRGCTLSPIYFHSFPYTGDKSKEKVLDLARVLARSHGPLTVSVVHFTDVQKQLRERTKAEFAVVLYRRMMLRAAERIARARGAHALVTGENLGQVASQTLINMGTIQDAAELPILRPLLAYDKHEIIDRAHDIGTYDLSIQPYDDCCSLFVPKHPATRARIEHARHQERDLPIDEWVDELAAGVEAIRIE